MKVFDTNLLRAHFGFDYAVREMQAGHDGVTDFAEKICAVSEDVYNGIAEDHPRSRFTGAHEFGHVVLHANQLTEQLREGRAVPQLYRGEIQSYEDPEWQANYFAGAILMPAVHMFELYAEGADEYEVADIFTVSRRSAEIRLSIIGDFAGQNKALKPALI